MGLLDHGLGKRDIQRDALMFPPFLAAASAPRPEQAGGSGADPGICSTFSKQAGRRQPLPERVVPFRFIHLKACGMSWHRIKEGSSKAPSALLWSFCECGMAVRCEIQQHQDKRAIKFW